MKRHDLYFRLSVIWLAVLAVGLITGLVMLVL